MDTIYNGTYNGHCVNCTATYTQVITTIPTEIMALIHRLVINAERELTIGERH